MSTEQRNGEGQQQKEPQNKGYSFVVGIIIGMAIIAVMVIFFNH